MMRFVSLSSLSVVFLGLRVSGFDEILGEPGTRAGNGAGSLAQLTNVDFGSAKSSPSPSLLLTTAAATTRTSACVSDSASPARNDLEYVFFSHRFSCPLLLHFPNKVFLFFIF